jgi:hypothetical protein
MVLLSGLGGDYHDLLDYEPSDYWLFNTQWKSYIALLNNFF